MTPPIIFINGRFLTQAVTGVQRYAIEAVKALDLQLRPGQDVRLLVPGAGLKTAPALRNIPVVRAGRLAGHPWEQFELPFYSRGGVLLNLCNPAPLYRTRQVALIHDMIVFAVPGCTSLLFRTWHQAMFRRVTRNSRTLITDSEFSRSEIIRILGTPPEKIKDRVFNVIFFHTPDWRMTTS